MQKLKGSILVAELLKKTIEKTGINMSDLIDQALDYVINANMNHNGGEDLSELTQRSVNIIEATKAKLLKKSLVIQQQQVVLRAHDMGIINQTTAENLIINGNNNGAILQIPKTAH